MNRLFFVSIGTLVLVPVIISLFYIKLPSASSLVDNKNITQTLFPQETSSSAHYVATLKADTEYPLAVAETDVGTSHVIYTGNTSVSEEEINQRFTGLLYHMHWLMDKRQTEFVGSTVRDVDLGGQVNRLERQIFRLMDNVSDDRRDDRSNLDDELANLQLTITESGETFLDPTLIDPILSGDISIGNYNEPANLTLTGSQTFFPGQMRGVGLIRDGENGADALAGAIFVTVAGDFAYVLSPTPTSTPSSGVNALQIIDVSDPANPVGVGSIRHGENGADAMENPRTVSIVGSYAYVASGMNNTGSHSLQIIDVSDPTNPVGVGSIRDGENGADGLRGAWGSTVVGGYAYVAGTVENALQIIDVSNPTHPVGVGSIRDGENGADAMSRPLHVAVSGRYAYVAAYNDDALQIIDISDPTNPVGVGSIRDGENGADGLDFPAFVAIIEPYAYVAGYNDNALQIIDISDPTNPIGVGSIHNGENGADAIHSPTSLSVFGNYAVLASSEGDAIQLIDISDPTNPIGVGSIRDGENGAEGLAYPNGLDVQGNYIYVASWMDNALQIISLEGLTAPTAKISNLLSTDMTAVRSRVSEFLTVDGGFNVGHNALINGALAIGGVASSSLRTTNTNPALVVHSGYVGFGTTTPSARLTVDGSIRFASLTGGTLEADALGNLTVSSDERLKDIVSSSTASLQAVLGLTPIEYYWNTVSGLDQSRTYVGFSSQNVQDFIPEAVGQIDDGFLTLSTRPILAAVVNAIKEIWANLTQLTNRVSNLEEENIQLKERLIQIENELEISISEDPEKSTNPEEPTKETIDDVPEDELETLEIELTPKREDNGFVQTSDSDEINPEETIEESVDYKAKEEVKIFEIVPMAEKDDEKPDEVRGVEKINSKESTEELMVGITEEEFGNIETTPVPEIDEQELIEI